MPPPRELARCHRRGLARLTCRVAYGDGLCTEPPCASLKFRNRFELVDFRRASELSPARSLAGPSLEHLTLVQHTRTQNDDNDDEIDFAPARAAFKPPSSFSFQAANRALARPARVFEAPLSNAPATSGHVRGGRSSLTRNCTKPGGHSWLGTAQSACLSASRTQTARSLAHSLVTGSGLSTGIHYSGKLWRVS